MSEVEEYGGGDIPGVGKERGAGEAGQVVTGVAESEAVSGCDLNEVYDIEAYADIKSRYLHAYNHL